ncbi:bacteriocin-associated integral membrane protein [Lacticaseibacillus zeae DSM 20178 = KCTC 3804]|uniref:Bacteriocin-associated integral membrane protein n=1 Tax=Lacticaseibacillus zeae DSM 20178 = KCTC 3804 TaxID=1423816 RepID=A0A0R1EKK8_LACZE|nr:MULTISPECIES: bacteriocin-associated integral membrane protein [Lacticaseibacillus]KLI74638.1 bacteriocin-associated integral membrane protein [Lacticaseibacillus casei]KRK09997.1 bacteriocin-associated integral membrane protein [Lacticaseibacillus zeae DSM 20178 = KCTC 3804]OLS06296.1 bacteriocin-associated protein [Lacticaseibacillus casei]QVI32417.1 bacteriocin-associated protein [Lacticaseibacillus zeae]
MFKKILKVTLLISVAIVASTWLVYLTEKHTTVMIRQISNIDDQHLSLSLPIQPTNDNDYQRVVKSISETATEMKLPVLKRTWYQGHGNEHGPVQYHRNVSDLTFESSQLTTTPLAKKFNMRFQNGKIYTTKNIANTESLRKYGNLDVTVKELNPRIISATREGDFFVETKDPKALVRFQKRLCTKLNERLHFDLSPSDFIAAPIPLVINSYLSDIQQIALSMSVFLFIFIIVSVLSLSYEIGVLRHLGYDVRSTFIQIIGPQIFWGNLTVLLFGVILFKMTDPKLMMPSLIVITICFLIEAIFAYTIMLITHQIPLSSILVKRTFSKRTFIGLYVLKGILLSFILLTILPLGDLAYQSLKVNTARDRSALKDYAVFFPTSIGYNQRALAEPQQTSEINQNILYPKIEHNGGLIIDTAATSQPIAPQYQGIDINENYLKFNPIYTISGKKFEASKNENGPIVLLPQQKNKLKRAITRYFVNDLKLKKPTITLIKNGQYLINESGQKVKISSYISVYTKHSHAPRNIFTGDARDPLKVALHGVKPEVVYNKYLPTLAKYNLTDNYPQLIRASNIDSHILHQTLGNITSGLVSMITSLIAFFFLAVSTAYLYFSIFGRTFAVKQILGFSTIQSSHVFWLLWLSISGLTIFTFLLGSHEITPSTVFLFALAFTIDFLISFISITIFSKDTIRRCLYD